VPRGRVNKYRAKPQVIDGIRFASKAEGARYVQLKTLQAARKIWGLTLQPKYPLNVMGKKICTYIPDFEYFEPMPAGEPVKIVEDVKGVETAAFKIKRKLFEVLYGIPLRVTKGRK
jgi:hypothetical protein